MEAGCSLGDLFGWVGGWVYRKVEGEETVGMSYCTSWLAGWVGGWVYLGKEEGAGGGGAFLKDGFQSFLLWEEGCLCFGKTVEVQAGGGV